MAQTRDWKLVFTCPRCKKASSIAAENLAAIVRCPHCRTNVVVDKDGIRAARKSRKRKSRSQKTNPQRNPRRIAKKGHEQFNRRVIWIGIGALIAVFIFRVSTSIPSFFNSSRDPTNTLKKAANRFQSAWLAGELETAKSIVVEADRAHFEKWARPRQAALKAGFGSSFKATVTEIKVTRKESSQAEVRVTFDIRGRTQHAYYQWKLDVDGNWRLILRQPENTRKVDNLN